MKKLLLIICTLNLSACATIVSGRLQTVTVQTNPTGAACELTRNGVVLGTISPTPGSLAVTKTKYDISIMCRKDGYLDTTGYLDSGTEGATFGNIIAGGLIGWGVDSISGADNKYAEMSVITLLPKEKVAP